VRLVIDQDQELLALVARCINGDNYAWETFCNQYGKVVAGYLFRLSYFRQNRDAVHDVTQEVFKKLWNGGLRNFRGNTKYQFFSYLKTTTIREANTFIANNPPRHDDEQHPRGLPDGVMAVLVFETQLKTYPLKDQDIFCMVAIGGQNI